MPHSLLQKMQDAMGRVVPFSGTCFRSVSQRFATRQQVLSAKGSLMVGGRFNFIGKFEVLYLSCDSHTCLEETTKSIQRPASEVAQVLPRTIIGIQVKLSRVLDLTDANVRRSLGITKQVLTE